MLFKRKCKITFIAHGATLYTEENRICDKESHPPLNEQGQEEAERIAKWIIHRSPRVDKIYTGASLSCVHMWQKNTDRTLKSDLSYVIRNMANGKA